MMWVLAWNPLGSGASLEDAPSLRVADDTIQMMAVWKPMGQRGLGVEPFTKRVTQGWRGA